MFAGIVNYIKKGDEIVKPSHTRLNFNGDVKQKTLIGGLLSYFIAFYVFYIAIKQGVRMANREGPKINS